MNRTLLRLLCVGLFLDSPALLAEVSVDPPGALVNTLVLEAITDDSDPIGVWLQHRPLAPNQVLNANGHERGDGRPDIAWRDNSWPVVTWAYHTGSDFDIAFSEWDGAQWTATVLLTATTEDERDPRLFVDPDGAVHIVWWTTGLSERVYLATRQPGSSVWDVPTPVTSGGESGRRPSVVVSDGELSVAYECDSVTPGTAQDVKIAVRQPAGEFTLSILGSTTRADALDVMLHAEQGHLWADWKHGTLDFGIEETRRAIRSLIVE